MILLTTLFDNVFFLNYFLILAIIAQISNPIAEPVISIGIPTKEAKDEMETLLVIIEANIRKCST